VFSVRQTGNQIGAMLGSAGLPLIALYAGPETGYGLVAGVAVLCAIAFLVLRPRYDPLTGGAGTVLRLAEQVALVRASPPLRRLALASMPWSMLQLSLNAFLVTFAVERVGLTHVTAGLLLATAQGGGLVGRLAWGLVAGRLGAGRVVAGLGLAMGLAALAMGLAGPALPTAALFGLALVFGLTASGWNGVFLAEVARLAPPERIAEATGAVLLSSYAGLVLGPLLVAGCAALGSLSISYAVIGALAAGATLPLLRTR
jgi:Na+/melibiose symporter-like transporter